MLCLYCHDAINGYENFSIRAAILVVGKFVQLVALKSRENSAFYGK